MLQWYSGYLDKAAESEETKSIRVWGTVGNKTDAARMGPRAHAAMIRTTSWLTADRRQLDPSAERSAIPMAGCRRRP